MLRQCISHTHVHLKRKGGRQVGEPNVFLRFSGLLSRDISKLAEVSGVALPPSPAQYTKRPASCSHRLGEDWDCSNLTRQNWSNLRLLVQCAEPSRRGPGRVLPWQPNVRTVSWRMSSFLRVEAEKRSARAGKKYINIRFFPIYT